MGRATTFLAHSALAAGAAALVISVGVGAADAAPITHPADTPLTCNSGAPLVGVVCNVATGLTDAVVPTDGANVVPALPASPVDVPVPSLPAPLNTTLVSANVPVRVCDVTASVIDSSTNGSCPAAPSSGPSISTGGSGPLVDVAAPVQVCGIAIGAIAGDATAPCPATGPTVTSDGSTGGLVGAAAPVQVCGVTVAAVKASAVGACPTTGPTAVSGTGGGLTALSAGVQVCGATVGAVNSTSAGDCPSTGQTVGSGDGGLITADVPVQVCGATAGAIGGTANGSCTESLPPTIPASTVPATTASGASTSIVANEITAGTTASDAEQLAPVANFAAADSGSSSGSGDGGGSLPVTGISIVAVLLGAGALMQSGIIAKTIAARKVRRTAA
ncbi:MAG: hypothetical protein JWN62_588 [Acidimicrobiales bacterium]|nr:hypothetical protein [Acidimicrobiales bacterium]